MKHCNHISAFFVLLLCLTAPSFAIEKGKRFNEKATLDNLPSLATETFDRVADEMIVKLKPSQSPRLFSTASPLQTADMRSILKVDFTEVRPLYRGKASNSPQLSAKTKAYTDFKQTIRDDAAFILKVETSKWNHAFRELKKNQAVEYVIPNYIVTSYAAPNDPYYDDLWGLHTIEFESVLGSAKFQREVLIAVVDSGLDLSHFDIMGKYFTNKNDRAGNGIDDDGNGFVDDVNGWSFVEGNGSMRDDNGHGTHVSGTVAAVNNNYDGIAGIVENAKILPVRVLNSYGNGSLSNIIAGIDYAVLMGAEVINLSLGVELDTSDANTQLFLQEQNARFRIISETQKVVVVVAAGNDHDNNIHNFWPAGAEHVVTVGALEKKSNDVVVRADFSNFGKGIDLWAPGVNILSLKSADSPWKEKYPGYALANGTSMAAPHVTGGAALVKSAFPDLTGNQVKRLLKQTTASFPAMMLEKGVLNLSHIEAVEQPLSSIEINLANDYYYIDNGFASSFEIHGLIGSAFSGTYTMTLEKEGHTYASTSGSFQASATEHQLLATFPFPSPAVDGLAKYTLVLTAGNSEGVTKTQTVPVMVNASSSLAENYKANHPFFGDHYSSYPGPQNVPYSNVIDLDKDGTSELVVVRSSHIGSPATQLFVYDLEGNLKDGFPYVFPLPAPINHTDARLFYKDVDQDGKLDIVALFMQKDINNSDTNTFEYLVIDSNGQKNTAASFSKVIHDTNELYIMNHMLLYTDFNGDGEEDIIVFQTVYNPDPIHLEANVYDINGTELLRKSYQIPEIGTSYYYLYDAFPITNDDNRQTKNYALFSSKYYGQYPLHTILFDSNLDFISIDASTNLVSFKYNYKTFDWDNDGYTDLGYISYDRNETHTQLKIYKNNLRDMLAVNLPVTTDFSGQIQFFVGNVQGDEQSELVLAATSSAQRYCHILDKNGIKLHSFNMQEGERLASLINADDDAYDELLLAPAFYFGRLAIVNADSSPVKEIQLTTTVSGINQLPAIWFRSYPYIAKIDQSDTYHLFFNNRKLNIVDLGISDSNKIRWFNDWGGNNNDFAMNIDVPQPIKGVLQVNLTASFPLSDIEHSTVKAVGDTTVTSSAFNSSDGFVTFDELPFGTYTLQFDFATDWYTYHASQEIEFTQSGQQADLHVTRTVNENMGHLRVNLMADLSFDRLENEQQILSIKNLNTGAISRFDISVKEISDSYVHYESLFSNVETDTDFEISLDLVKNEFHYWIDPTIVRTKTDDINNSVTILIEREPTIKALKVVPIGAFHKGEIHGSLITATNGNTSVSLPFDYNVGFVIFEDLPFGMYTLHLETESDDYTYQGTVSVDYSQGQQDVELQALRRVKPGRSFVHFRISTNPAFDRIDGIMNIVTLKDLDTGTIIDQGGNTVMAKTTDDGMVYVNNYSRLNPNMNLEISLEAEVNGYRYWVDAINFTTMIDHHANYVFCALKREKIVDEVLKVVPVGSFSLEDIDGSTITATRGDTVISLPFDVAVGSVTFEDLPSGSYTLDLEFEAGNYTYEGTATVDYSQEYLCVNLEVQRLIKPGLSFVHFRISTDPAFDRIEGIRNIVTLKNLDTGTIIDQGGNKVMARTVNDGIVYVKNYSGLNPNMNLEISLEVEVNGYRYWVDAVTFTTRTDYHANYVYGTLQRETIVDEVLKVVPVGSFNLEDIDGSTITATRGDTVVSLPFDVAVGSVTFEDLPSGSYTLGLEFEAGNYTYEGTATVEYSQQYLSVNLEVQRLIKPGLSFVHFRISTDPAFDRIEGIRNIVTLKNLDTGTIIDQGGNKVMARTVDDGIVYVNNYSGLNPNMNLEISLEVEVNGYRYWVDAVTFTTRTDYHANYVYGTLQRETIVDEVLKVVPVGSFNLEDIDGSTITATRGDTVVSLPFDVAVGSVTFEDLPSGSYTLDLEFEAGNYTYEGTASVEYSQQYLSVNLEVQRLIKPGKSFVNCRISTDPAFDRIDGIANIVTLKNLDTGTRIDQGGNGVAAGSTNDGIVYIANYGKLNPNINLEFSLEVELNGYRYWVDAITFTTRTDYHANYLYGTLNREEL